MSVTQNKIIFGQAPRSPLSAIATAANTAMAGQGVPPNAVKICDAGPNGSLVRRLKARPLATSTTTTFPQNQAQLLKYNGTAFVLDDDATIPAQSVSLGGGTSAADFGYTDTAARYLPAGCSLYAALGTAYTNGVAFTADVADL